MHITHVSCLGSETHIRECFLSCAEDDSPNSQRCSHSNDVGVQCSGMYFITLFYIEENKTLRTSLEKASGGVLNVSFPFFISFLFKIGML